MAATTSLTLNGWPWILLRPTASTRNCARTSVRSWPMLSSATITCLKLPMIFASPGSSGASQRRCACGVVGVGGCGVLVVGVVREWGVGWLWRGRGGVCVVGFAELVLRDDVA